MHWVPSAAALTAVCQNCLFMGLYPAKGPARSNNRPYAPGHRTHRQKRETITFRNTGGSRNWVVYVRKCSASSSQVEAAELSALQKERAKADAHRPEATEDQADGVGRDTGHPATGSSREAGFPAAGPSKAASRALRAALCLLCWF